MALEVRFKPAFVRAAKNLEKDLVVELLEKVELFKDFKNHRLLKVHKLHGQLADCWSFSVNYKTRVVFQYETKTIAVLLAIGDHDVYK